MTTPAGRAVWSGSIAFGPVNIPVKAHLAVGDEREDLKFHQVDRKDGARIQMRRFNSATGEEVPYSDIAKGLEWGAEIIVFDDSDLADLPVPTAKVVEIEQFCDADEISPLLFDKPYYLVPQKGAERAYRLLYQAMDSRRCSAAVGRVTLSSKERLVAIERGEDQALVMTTLRGPGAVRAVPEFPQPLSVDQLELAMAGQMVAMMVKPFKEDEHVDRWAQAVRKVAEDKAAGVKAAAPEPAPEFQPQDLMDTLTAAVAALKAAKS
jgi:DNA end-binding protein Ku